MKQEDWLYRLHDGAYRLQRRRLMGQVDKVYREIVGGWKQDEFRERFRNYWNPFPITRPAKFLDLNVWLREAIYRYFLWTGLPDREPGLRVLDLGAGTGYFLVVCRHLGHRVLGLDLDTEPLYRECFDFFGLDRIIYRIEPMTPLIALPHEMDVITAFMTAFNIHDDGSPWGVDEWTFLLRDLRARLSARGRIIIRFNVNKKTGNFYSDEVHRAIRAGSHYRARFLRDYLFLDAV